MNRPAHLSRPMLATALGLVALWLGGAAVHDHAHDEAAAPGAASQPAEAARPPRTGPGLYWKFVKGEPIRYDLNQTLTVKTSVPAAGNPPPMTIQGLIELQPIDADKARFLLRAEKQLPEAPRPPTPPPADTGASCSCRRAGPPPAAKPEPPSRPEPPRTIHGMFTLLADGSLESSDSAAGGQTELMSRLLMPLPGKELKVGESTQDEVEVPQTGDRFPMLGTRTVTYVSDQQVEGRTLALIKTHVEMKGAAHPAAGMPGPQAKEMEGATELRAETEGLFDLQAGRYDNATSRIWFQLNTARTENGVKKAVTLEQEQVSTLTLRPAAATK